jgi:hypothetical protein
MSHSRALERAQVLPRCPHAIACCNVCIHCPDCSTWFEEAVCSELERLHEIVVTQRALLADSPITESELLALLRKLASGEGGRRTGELKRRGWLEWTVTAAGRRALDGEGE